MINNILERQKKWKEFERTLIPIIKTCRICQDIGICIFHEKWLSKVKEKWQEDFDEVYRK